MRHPNALQLLPRIAISLLSIPAPLVPGVLARTIIGGMAHACRRADHLESSVARETAAEQLRRINIPRLLDALLHPSVPADLAYAQRQPHLHGCNLHYGAGCLCVLRQRVTQTSRILSLTTGPRLDSLHVVRPPSHVFSLSVNTSKEIYAPMLNAVSTTTTLPLVRKL